MIRDNPVRARERLVVVMWLDLEDRGAEITERPRQCGGGIPRVCCGFRADAVDVERRAVRPRASLYGNRGILYGRVSGARDAGIGRHRSASYGAVGRDLQRYGRIR